MSDRYSPSIKIDFNNPKFTQLTLEEEQALGRAVQEHGCIESRNRLVTSHMRFAMKIASGFHGRSKQDIQQEANEGLIKAADRFDPEKGFRFSTYATWWIKAFIQDHIIKNYSMVKNGTTSENKKLFFNLRRAEKELNHKQTGLAGFEFDAELARMLGVSIEKVQEGRVRLTKNASLNAPLSTDGEGGSWIDWLEDDGMQVKDIIEDNSKMNHARNAFASAVSQTLNDREKDILIRRRLKEDQDTLETLSSEYEVSKERVRQIEVAALEKIAQHISNETGLDIDMANLSHIKTGKQAKVIHPKTLTNA